MKDAVVLYENNSYGELNHNYLAPIGGGRGIVMPMYVCLFVCVCLCVCLCVCPCFRKISKWCQNVGEYNTYNCCIWHFGLCVIVSKIDRCRSSDPPYEIAINPWWRGGRGLPSLIALLICGMLLVVVVGGGGGGRGRRGRMGEEGEWVYQHDRHTQLSQTH